MFGYRIFIFGGTTEPVKIFKQEPTQRFGGKDGYDIILWDGLEEKAVRVQESCMNQVIRVLSHLGSQKQTEIYLQEV